MLEKQNNELKKMVEGEIHTIELSDRKTYYENEQNTWIEWWSNQFKSNYWLLIFLLVLAIGITNRLKDKQLWMKVVGVAIYPYVAFLLIQLVLGIWNWILSDTKWVYLHANM